MFHGTQAAQGVHHAPLQVAQVGEHAVGQVFQSGNDIISRGRVDQVALSAVMLRCPVPANVPSAGVALYKSCVEAIASQVQTGRVALPRAVLSDEKALYNVFARIVAEHLTTLQARPPSHTAYFDLRTYDEWKREVDPAHWDQFLQSWDRAIIDAFAESYQLGREALARRSRSSTAAASGVTHVDSSASLHEEQASKPGAAALGADVPLRTLVKREQTTIKRSSSLASHVSQVHCLQLPENAHGRSYRKAGGSLHPIVHADSVLRLIRSKPNLTCEQLAKDTASAVDSTRWFLRVQGLHTVRQRKSYAQAYPLVARNVVEPAAVNTGGSSDDDEMGTSVTSPRTFV